MLVLASNPNKCHPSSDLLFLSPTSIYSCFGVDTPSSDVAIDVGSCLKTHAIDSAHLVCLHSLKFPPNLLVWSFAAIPKENPHMCPPMSNLYLAYVFECKLIRVTVSANSHRVQCLIVLMPMYFGVDSCISFCFKFVLAPWNCDKIMP